MLKNILIADDERFIRQGLKRMIEQMGDYTVYCARNGQEALAVLQKTPVDMVLTDISMPLMNGIEFLRTVSKMRCHPVLIIISGYNDFQYAVDGMRSGVVDYLLKPIDDKRVKALLEQYQEWGEEQNEKDYGLQLLQRDIRYAAVNAEQSPEQDREMQREITARINSPQTFLFMLRTRSLFFESTVEKELERELGQKMIFVDNVGKWQLVLAGSVPAFLRSPSSDAPFWAGGVEVDDGRFFELCNQARNAARYGFLTGTRFVWAREAQENKETQARSAMWEICVAAVGVGDNGAVRAAIEHNWNEKIRWQMNPGDFDLQLRQLLARLEEEYPQVCRRYGLLADELTNYLTFSDWQEFSCKLQAYLYLIASGIQESGMHRYSQKIQEALQYIEKNYSRDINLATVANQVSLNYSVLSREFANQVGVNFVNYLKQYRVNEAKRRLLETQKKSADIGREAGFVNERQYVKAFREMVGMTPTEYRKLHPDSKPKD